MAKPNYDKDDEYAAQQNRIEELRYKVEALGGYCGTPSENCPPDIEEQFLKNVLAYETAQYKPLFTATGKYRLVIYGMDEAGNSPESIVMDGVPIRRHMTHRYVLDYSAKPDRPARLSGGFSGDREDSIPDHRLLSYASPSQKQLTLTAGARNFPVIIFYGSDSLPQTLVVTLNGTPVTSLFHPRNRVGREVVIIKGLKPGQNKLVFSIDGKVSGEKISRTDDFVLELAR